MKVIVDTSIWSLALRRKRGENYSEINKLVKLIDNFHVIMLGEIRQEILSGIKLEEQFGLLQNYLRAFPNFDVSANDFETAANYFNICRKRGIQGSNTDFLICAVAVNHQFKIFTNDNDFKLYKKIIPIQLLDKI